MQFVTGELFKDRAEAGQRFAPTLRHLQSLRPIVLGLDTGGVPIAYEVAKELNAPLGLLLQKKYHGSGRSTYGIEAVASVGGDTKPMVVRIGSNSTKPLDAVAHKQVRRELEELRRKHLYYTQGEQQLLPPLAGRVVVICDDGIGTGWSAAMALQALGSMHIRKGIFVAPMGKKSALDELRLEFGFEVLCMHELPGATLAVGYHYGDYSAVNDDYVMWCINEVVRRRVEQAPPPPAHKPRPSMMACSETLPRRSCASKGEARSAPSKKGLLQEVNEQAWKFHQEKEEQKKVLEQKKKIAEEEAMKEQAAAHEKTLNREQENEKRRIELERQQREAEREKALSLERESENRRVELERQYQRAGKEREKGRELQLCLSTMVDVCYFHYTIYLGSLVKSAGD